MYWNSHPVYCHILLILKQKNYPKYYRPTITILIFVPILVTVTFYNFKY
jgi:hypothetical protein